MTSRLSVSEGDDDAVVYTVDEVLWKQPVAIAPRQLCKLLHRRHPHHRRHKPKLLYCLRDAWISRKSCMDFQDESGKEIRRKPRNGRLDFGVIFTEGFSAPFYFLP